MSLNALAEYLTAPAGRRRTIIAAQKRPKTYRVTYYADAESAIIDALTDSVDLTALDRATERLLAMEVDKEQDAARRQAQLEAIGAFRAFRLGNPAPALPAMRRATRRPPPYVMSGVVISVRPELLVLVDADRTVGALKLYFSKNERLTVERGRYAGTILHDYVEQFLAPGQPVDYHQCLVLDVFGRALYSAPRTYRRERRDVGAACAEIFALWPTA